VVLFELVARLSQYLLGILGVLGMLGMLGVLATNAKVAATC